MPRIPIDRLTLERISHEPAAVGMISLPLPRDASPGLSIDHPDTALHPVAWWERDRIPRRSLAFVIDEQAVPDSLTLAESSVNGSSSAVSPWTVTAAISREQLDYTRHAFTDIASLRGVPAAECTRVEFTVALSYGGHTLTLQCGASGPDGGPCWWENVQVDRLWRNGVVEAMRIGGVIHNADTYLWADIYLLLFANGVAHATVHFVNTKLHIEGYDFQGLPVLRFAGEGLLPIDASLPADGACFDLGPARLNLADSSILYSEAHPGHMSTVDGGVHWRPFDRTFNPQLEEAPVEEWAKGAARTLRFQLSFSDAPAAVARYRAPSWWYALCGEPWPWPYLPVLGRYARMGELASDHIRGQMVRGRFDGGSAAFGNDGFAGIGLMQTYYQTGRADLQADALAYCYFWADLMVDHADFSIRQWVGGWGWKTCAYSKFRDILFGYLETGDPYLLETVENCADAYWFWFRANWPRCTIGRDAFELGGWAMLWRFLRTERARERTQELVRMLQTVLETRGSVGGQMGAGPHPGYHSSLYMTGVCMNSVLEAAEACVEAGMDGELPALAGMLAQMHDHFIADDTELFPSNLHEVRADWHPRSHKIWATLGMRIYPELLRLPGISAETAGLGLRKTQESSDDPLECWAPEGRPGDNFIYPRYHDALLLGAQVHGDGILLEPVGEPSCWPSDQVVSTPFGELAIAIAEESEKITWRFSSKSVFPITLRVHDDKVVTTSQGGCARL